MNTKHTPGPWHRGSIDPEFIFAEQGRMALEIGGTTLYSIAQCTTGFDKDEDDANARLISAAPDLLEALERLYEDASDRDEVLDDEGIMYDDWARALAAIKKAKGES